MARRSTRQTGGRSLTQSLTLILRRRDWLLAKTFLIAGAVLLAGATWYIWPYWQLSGRFASLPLEQPSRLYSRAFRIGVGDRLTSEKLVERLVAARYVPAVEGELLPGTYRESSEQISILRRRFPGFAQDRGGTLAVIDFAGGKVIGIQVAGAPAREAFLDPALLASYYGEDLLERRPTPLPDIAPIAVRAVLAAEDASFFEHPGLSFTGILRAFWVNLRGSGVRQGGSTVTQQLAKNLYLTSERTMGRKLREAMLAVMLEWRYSKEEILEAYLNQIFWGRSGAVNLIGIGSASAAYFGKEPRDLNLAESALLGGMIRAPAAYHPVDDAEPARARRKLILARLAELEWTTDAEAEAAEATPLPVPQPPFSRRIAPYFADAAATEAARRFALPDLADRGYTLLSTLDPFDQASAEVAVREGLEALAERSERVRKKETPLQAALVSIEPGSGAVRAYVGGRDYRQSQFDRASSANRQAGSAFKPFVYATAFELGVATPGTLLEDAPLTLTSGGQVWSPNNDDDEFHGWVTARTAVEQSYNVPTVRLALATGLPKIVEQSRALGVSARLQPVPSIALGAFEIAPVEMVTAYATFANRGVRPTPRTLEGILDAEGHPVAGSPLPASPTVLSPQSAFLVTSLLQGVVDYGTARSARGLGLKDPIAGKTGTSNGGRDSWFAGFSPERATVVWVGFDDDSPTPFSGSKAALPIWTSFTLAVRPAGGYSRFTPPAGIRVVLIDPASGQLATDRCPQVLSEAFPAGRIPAEVCYLHGGRFELPLDPELRAEKEQERREGGIGAWLKRVFRKRERGPEPN